jgi:E3 ubiquitin-protein ligase DOA10
VFSAPLSDVVANWLTEGEFGLRAIEVRAIRRYNQAMNRRKRRIGWLIVIFFMLLIFGSTSLPFIWLAQGRLTRENFDGVQATFSILMLLYALLAFLVVGAIRIARFKDKETEGED